MLELPTPTTDALSLVERKQRAARNRIIAAADVLFADRGFDNVSVSDIAERAEVGRTTFFRYFKDKTEVVFAKEQAVFDAITDVASTAVSSGLPVESLAAALGALEPLVIQLCEYATADPTDFQRHAALVSANDDLRAREAVKHQQIAREFTAILFTMGASRGVATLAGQLAVACYTTGSTLSTTPEDLASQTREAFRATSTSASAVGA